MRKNWIKKAGAAVLGLILTGSLLAGCGSGSAQTAQGADEPQAQETETAENESAGYRTLEEIQASGKVTIGVFSDKSPFGYVDENGEYQGYDVYFGNRIAQDLGVELEYVSTEAKVDIILANFTVTPERAEEVDFALPYMNVALGVVSHNDRVITDLSQVGADDQVIVISGTTAETYLTKNNPEIKLQKFDTYAAAKSAFENGTGVAWANDNTEVIAFAAENEGYTVGIDSLGSADTIAPAVTKGNESLLNWLNEEIVKLGEEKFFHADYEATLVDTYGIEFEDTLVIEGGGQAAAPAQDAGQAEEKGTIKIAASPIPHAEILEEAGKILAAEGWKLEVVIFEDYVQPNLVVESGELDANYFQHIPYLESFNEENKTHLVNAGGIHYEPFGIYAGTRASLEELQEGDAIAIPNDTTNEARALLLLQDNGVIKLKEGAGLTATVLDIESNPLNLDIVELEAAQVSRVRQEVAAVVLNGNYALEAGLTAGRDAITYEASDSEAAKTYVNVVAVKEGNENNEGIQALVKVLKSEEIKKFINDKYEGAVIPFED